ncbi:transcriptional regulator [Natrinema sp. 1APR25-10V2]|nr:transcriptional regulator [Natrinema sp. 1APR25-10V2]
MNDKMFDALADVQRRRLLLGLLDHNPQNVTELSNVPWDITEQDKDLIKKHHVHLPKLAQYGYIEWDREASIVTKGPQFDEIRPLLEFLEANRN